MTASPLQPPARYVAPFAVSFATPQGDSDIVSATNPLPVSMASATAPTALSGSASATSQLGPFLPISGRPVMLALSGSWSGQVRILRSTNGGATKLPLTALGAAYGTYTANLCEPVWEEGNGSAFAETAFKDRPFVFIGRWVDKKNLPNLVDAYALYAAQAGENAHRMVLAGSGEEEAEILRRIERGNVSRLVDLPGFLPADAVAKLLANALALILVSREEQWGLVVNEALAFGLPVIVSRQVGSRDALVRDGENGCVVDSESIEGIAAALLATAADPTNWQRMADASLAKAWLGDTDRLAEAVESMVLSNGRQSVGRMTEFAGQVL